VAEFWSHILFEKKLNDQVSSSTERYIHHKVLVFQFPRWKILLGYCNSSKPPDSSDSFPYQ
jgi:hypothetical protein